MDIYLVETECDVATIEVKNPSHLTYCTQTTLSVSETAGIIEALKARFPDIKVPKKEDICYATENRQQAVRALALDVDVFIVLGAANSSNSNRLRDLAEDLGTKAYLVDDASALDPAWFIGCQKVGISAGASAPDILVQEVITRLSDLFDARVVSEVGTPENIAFSLPKMTVEIKENVRN